MVNDGGQLAKLKPGVMVVVIKDPGKIRNAYKKTDCDIEGMEERRF